jgi:hypothetical protein
VAASKLIGAFVHYLQGPRKLSIKRPSDARLVMISSELAVARMHENKSKKGSFISISMDVWWIVQDGQLLLLIAYLLRQHRGNAG